MEPLYDGAVCTSSVRKRRWSVDGSPRHHLVDPRTGHCLPDVIDSVTVVGASATQCEVLAKAAMVAGHGAPTVLDEFGATAFIRWSAAERTRPRR